MPFGQPAGPPATATQTRALLDLVQRAGHTDFRDARGPLGLNQRQAGGRFTRDEAEALIDQLRGAEEQAADGPAPAAPAPRPPDAVRPAPTAPGAADRLLRDVPAERLAAELTRRGWMVIEPLDGP